MSTQRQRAISVIGMHRSGTSAIARICNLLGCHIGRPEYLMLPGEDNPEGFWEHARVFAFHERLLRTLSRSWDDIQSLPENWWNLQEIEPCRKELMDLVRREFGDQPLWMWKDPRTSLFLPLWKKVLEELEADVHYLICVRNPLEVAASLNRRNRFSKNKSLALWYYYNVSSLYWTNGVKRSVLHYDRVLENWARSLSSVSGIFNIPWPPEKADLNDHINGFLRSDLRHSRFHFDSLTHDPQISDSIIELYRLLIESAETPAILDSIAFAEKVSRLYGEYSVYSKLFGSIGDGWEQTRFETLWGFGTPGKEHQENGWQGKSEISTQWQKSLEEIVLDKIEILNFPSHDRPRVSIIIPVWDRWKFTCRCLQSVLENTEEVAYEVIVVDNGSGDDTPELLRKVKNIRILRHPSNLGFVVACNEGARKAQGDYLLFLNNDVMVTRGWLKPLVTLLEDHKTVGATGPKLISPEGALDEAGGIIWTDGSLSQYGEGSNPDSPEFCYVREADYCSGACLLVRKDLFFNVGGFDEIYSPGYYEDSDLCLALKRSGYRIVFHPGARVIHQKHGSSSKKESLALYLRNMPKFAREWSDVLRHHLPPYPRNMLYAREARKGKRVLVLDDRIPSSLDKPGFRRGYLLLKSLSELGYVVTFFPVSDPFPYQPFTRELQMSGIEVFYGGGFSPEEFMKERSRFYEAVVISGSQHVIGYLKGLMDFFPGAFTLCDTGNWDLSPALASLKAVDAIIVPGETESRKMEQKGFKNILIWSPLADPSAPEPHPSETKLRLAQFLKKGLHEREMKYPPLHIEMTKDSYIQDLQKKIGVMEEYIQSLKETITAKDQLYAILQSDVASMMKEKDRYIDSLVHALNGKTGPPTEGTE